MDAGDTSPITRNSGTSGSTSPSVITKIVVKNVTLDPKQAIAAIRSQRVPVGMYIVVSLNDFECKMANKPITPCGDMEWENEIALPSDPSSEVFIRVYASFELGSTLSSGELLHATQVNARELLENNEKLFTFLVSPEEINSIPIFSSLLVTVDYRQEPTSLSYRHYRPAPVPDIIKVTAEMTEAGYNSLFRYRKYQQEEDLADGVEKFETALDACPVDNPYRVAAIFNLAAAKFISSQTNLGHVELDKAITLYREALHLRRSDDLDRTNNLFHLAIALLHRSDEQRLVPDREEAKDLLLLIQAELSPAYSLHHQGASLVIETFHLLNNDHVVGANVAEEPDVDSHREDLLSLLNGALTQCVDGNIERLDEIILGYRNAISSHKGGLLYPTLMGNLGVALKLRFDRDDEQEDLDNAISQLQESVLLSPNREMTVNNLAATLWIRFKRRGDEHDLDNAITYWRNALELAPVQVPVFKSLATALSWRYEIKNDQKDLDESISRGFFVLMALFSPLSRDFTFRITHADRLRERYVLLGNQRDLEISGQILQSALAHIPGDHETRSVGLYVFGRVLCLRYKDCGGDKRSLDYAISCYQQALELMPPHDRNRLATVRYLAEAYSTRFERSYKVDDLTREILLLEEYLLSNPNDVTRLCALSRAQRDRFLHRGDRKDLDDAILRLRKCLERPLSNKETEEVTADLARTLVTRHDCLDASLETMDEAIQLYRRLLSMTSPDDINHAGLMNNLASALNSRFRRTHDNATLDELTRLYQEVLASTLLTGPSRAKPLTNLGSIIELRNTTDVDQAISLHQEALESQPDGDPFRPTVLYNMAKAYLGRYSLLQNIQDLDQADLYARQALEAYAQDAVERGSALLFLAETACAYFEHERNNTDSDLVRSRKLCILLELRASSLHTEPGYAKPNESQPERLVVARRYLESAMELRSSSPIWGLRASWKLVKFAEKYNHESALSAYTQCLELLDGYSCATSSISARHEFMRVFPRTLAIDAASCALRFGNTCRAVELLEQGRTLIWTQMSRYRTPIDELLLLDEHSSQLATKFRNLSSLLNNPQMEDGHGLFPEEKARNHQRIVEDWSSVVEEIRKLDHFKRFLLPPLFSDLQKAACDGPVVILSASQYSCDAIIVLHDQPPRHAKLPTDVHHLMHLANSLRTIVYRTRNSPASERSLRELLQQLWDLIVSPVVLELEQVIKKRSRIWWCPASVFTSLPIHAAGEFFRSQGRHLSQIYISSYTPSLSALIKARASKSMATTKHFVVIGQAQPPNYSLPLASVEPELGLVENLTQRTTMEFSKITSASSTKAEALRALKQNEWIHLACHGVQHVDEPYRSCFLMRDEPLTLFDISRLELKPHEFAFLSACETAVGTRHTPDEVVHLAAGLQFSGIKSVICTMWEVEDATTLLFVEAFYKHMFQDGKADCTKAAESLHKALRSPAAKRMTLAQQTVFIHIGI